MRIIQFTIIVLLLSACNGIKQSSQVRVKNANKELLQYMPYPLLLDFAHNTDWSKLKIEATNARFFDNNDTAYQGKEFCVLEGKKTQIKIFEVNGNDSVLVALTEYFINPVKPVVTFQGVSGKATLSKEVINKCKGLKLEYLEHDVRPVGGVLSYDVEVVIGSKIVTRKFRTNNFFPNEFVTMLRQKDLKKFKIFNIVAKYGCTTLKHSLAPIEITVG